MTLTMLIVVILIALIFEYINGFHDCANAIATVVSTKVLRPGTAVIYGAVFNFLGAFAGTHVATTIGKGIVTAGSVDQNVILASLTGAIVWNILTWYYGMPSSSSHALIGGLMGASVAHSGLESIKIEGVIEKVILPMIFSPMIGFMVGFVFMLGLLWIFAKTSPDKVNKYFRSLQLLSSGLMAYSHGSNDAQKTMGIITLALVSYHSATSFEVPLWVIALCAFTMAIGTMAGGWRIIKTMGSKIINLKPIHGFAAETSAAGIILTASHFGMPISTTHIISTSIIGVGSARSTSVVKWGIVGNIVFCWILTIPLCMYLSYLIYIAFRVMMVIVTGN